MYFPLVTCARGDRSKFDSSSLPSILYSFLRFCGNFLVEDASKKLVDRTHSFSFNCSVDNQHIGSVPMMKQSHTTHTHALWFSVSIDVLVIKFKLLSNGPLLSIDLHNSGIFF